MAREEIEAAIRDGEESAMYSAEYWGKEIELAEKRLDKYFTRGDKIVERYLDFRGEKDAPSENDPQFRLNLFHTHVSMLQAMLYGRIPQVTVRRKWEDANDDVARVAALTFDRLLNSTVDEPGESFGDVLRACLQDRLLPGHGVARVRYEFESEEVANPGYDEDLEEDDEINPKTLEDLLDESAPIDYVHWRDFLWGYGRMWSDLPWVAFRIYLRKFEVKEKFGEEAANQVEYVKQKVAKEGNMSLMEKSPTEQAEIFEIWCKESGKVYFWSKGCDDNLKELDDPLGLKGFFPCPEPLIANPTTTLYRPTADWVIAQDLYNEIDVLQTRISMITKAVKVVGVYDQSNEGLKRMMQEGFENDLIPVDNWAMFAEKNGLKGTVDWFPVQEVAAVLTQLEEIRGNTIQMLYEVTGLSDILRGAAGPDRESAQSASARTKFASIRVQHLQDEFARFASDLMTLRAQVIAQHWEPETIFLKSNAEFFFETEESKQGAMALIKQQPQFWPWRIEIKAESIAMIDYAQMQSERTEFLTMMGTYLQSMSSLVQVAPQAAPMLLGMMKWAMAGFKGAQEIEGLLDKLVEFALEEIKRRQENPPPDPEQVKAQAKLKEIEAKSQAKQKELAMKAQGDLMQLHKEFAADMIRLEGEVSAAEYKEKMQAYFNILEKMAAEQAKAQADAMKLEGELEKIREQAKVQKKSD